MFTSSLYLITSIGILIYLYFKKQNDSLKTKSTYNFSKLKNIDTFEINKSTNNFKTLPDSKLRKNFKTHNLVSQMTDNRQSEYLLKNSLEQNTHEYNRAYNELVNFGCKPIHDGNKLAIRVSKSLDGRWFYCKKSGLNSKKDRIYLTLNRMPYLQTLLLKIELNDPLLKIQGGRVLISHDGHYRKNLISSHISTFQVN